MATPATNTRKIGNLYANLTPQERVRLTARLFREHNREEMGRLRDATPPEHANVYNRAVGLLRTLTSPVSDWITASHLGMERDRLMLQYVALHSSHRWLTHARLADVWKLVTYPVTESEYRAIVELERGELEPLEDFTQYILETWDPDSNDLRGDVQAWLREAPDETEMTDTEARQALKRLMAAAIERGELPEPERTQDGPALPRGTLYDWLHGTTPDTYKPHYPDHAIPAIGRLFGGNFGAKWEIRPDSDADTVRERRGELLKAFLSLAGVHHPERAALTSLDPPLTRAERERAKKLADNVRDAWDGHDQSTEAAVASARSHARQRAQLYAIVAAIETIQRDDFGGEDPLLPEIREALEEALTEAANIQAVWEYANHAIGSFRLREAMGLPWGKLIHKEATADEPDPLPEREPAPLPEEEPDVAATVALIHRWGEMS